MRFFQAMSHQPMISTRSGRGVDGERKRSRADPDEQRMREVPCYWRSGTRQTCDGAEFPADAGPAESQMDRAMDRGSADNHSGNCNAEGLFVRRTAIGY